MSETKAEMEAENGPPHHEEWQIFLQELSEHDQYCSWFGPLPLIEARRVWSLMEQEFFDRYQFFVRLWPEWGSSGLWQIYYPGSRFAGRHLDPTESLNLSAALQERLKRWQKVYDSHDPCAPEKFDWRSFEAEAESLVQILKIELGSSIYVEYHELQEVLLDGSVRNWRPRLGLPQIPSSGEVGEKCP